MAVSLGISSVDGSQKATRLHSHRCENIKSCIQITCPRSWRVVTQAISRRLPMVEGPFVSPG
jgi:hypothetical protein